MQWPFIASVYHIHCTFVDEYWRVVASLQDSSTINCDLKQLDLALAIFCLSSSRRKEACMFSVENSRGPRSLVRVTAGVHVGCQGPSAISAAIRIVINVVGWVVRPAVGTDPVVGIGAV
jgi:hypothetical protein